MAETIIVSIIPASAIKKLSVIAGQATDSAFRVIAPRVISTVIYRYP